MSRLRPALAALLMRVASACITAAEWLDPIDLPPGLDDRVHYFSPRPWRWNAGKETTPTIDGMVRHER